MLRFVRWIDPLVGALDDRMHRLGIHIGLICDLWDWVVWYPFDHWDAG